MQFRKRPYGSKGIECFLRDVLALANTSVDGPRFVVIGVDIDSRGRRRVHKVSEKDFLGKPAYTSLANDYIEPPLKIRYKPLSIDGDRVGVVEIGNCQDRPYMMRVDYSETLRRGDAYLRLDNTAIKMGRRQLQLLFEKKFQDSVSARNIEVGFPGEIIHKDRTIKSCDLSGLPSAMAASKLEQLLQIQMNSSGSGSTTVMARLVHARLYGSDDPYISRSVEELVEEMKQIGHQYRHHDRHFLFEENCERLQLVVYNQGAEPVVDASIALVLPKGDDLFIADRLPKVLRDDEFVDRSPDDIASYPSVNLHKKSIHISRRIGDIPVDEPVEVFASPVRICVGPALVGRRFGIRYTLHGRNLRSPATGKLRLNFGD